MNKQQLATKIWESANRMRSKIEANEYKDYILGFIFYKYLSDKEEQWLYTKDYTKEDIKNYVNESAEDDDSSKSDMQQSLGYFIAYENLFSTWIDMGPDFSVDNVRVALSSFSRLISESHKNVFEGIFNTLETGLSKLGENAKAQTKAVSDLIHLIDEIPINGRQDYDVLGFIYEYLISKFAANAGKKAGEFYTPHEMSLLMSEIVANHLKDRSEIKILDYARNDLFKFSDRRRVEAEIDKDYHFIEKVRLDYRNPSAHRDRLTITSAKGCLEYVIDVQHMLKEMLSTMKI